jgi:hypothetical protein
MKQHVMKEHVMKIQVNEENCAPNNTKIKVVISVRKQVATEEKLDGEKTTFQIAEGEK